MYSQRRVLEAIQDLSPTRDRWLGLPAADLPPRVTVNFVDSRRGWLDMRDPRAIHWARVIDRLATAGRPVYAEIDEETEVITRVLIPEVFKVERMDPDENTDLLVRFKESAAIHVLLRSTPDFESMRASLQAALDDGTERLVTETRDEHEIIDVRQPASDSAPSPGPAPTPPPDPPVSEDRASEIFGDLQGRSCNPCSPSSECIPFLYPDDGCWIRAHIMCHLMRDGIPDPATDPPEDPQKVWIHASSLLVAPTANHPDCYVKWGWHVAPTLSVSLSGGDELRVIDPSLSPGPESKADWKGRQGDPGASLTDTDWTDYNSVDDNRNVSLSEAYNYMQTYRDRLEDRCLDFGPPPYSCTKKLFFIIDRNTFSDDEIEAMLHETGAAHVSDAFYVVLDGFSPQELGFTDTTMSDTPDLDITPAVPGMSFTPDRIVFEYPTHLHRRQRITWVYDISFPDTSEFTAERRTITVTASFATEAGTGYFHLIQQPNPYELDGETSWLSTDLRVFQLEAGQSKLGATLGSDPTGFIAAVIDNLNTGNTGGQTFENDISLDQQTSRLELSQTVDGTAVYNFAIAKVRYRALSVSATDVRVFFRLFPVATTSLEYETASAYRWDDSSGAAVPLLGIKNGEVAAFPCFASPRIDSAVASMATQTDPPNTITIPPNPSGAEVVRYFGCWLDFNQTTPQFPIAPSPLDGPWSSGRIPIQEHIRNEHQCLVSEIAFAPAPAQNGSSPSTSDKLAQRNLAIVESENPGPFSDSRRIPQTFEVRPSTSRVENDELMIDWSNVPDGSVATLYMPGFDAGEILRLAARKFRTHRLVRLDEHTVRFATGGINYIPLPFADGNFPGLLTVDLPEGVRKGQVFNIVVRQVAGSWPNDDVSRRVKLVKTGARHIVGSFQLTMPVRDRSEILPRQQRLLSNLRWIRSGIPVGNRWWTTFDRYVDQIARRVDALGGDSGKVAPSPNGQWREAYRRCGLLATVVGLLVALVFLGAGVLPGGLAVGAGATALAVLGATWRSWRLSCRPSRCRILVTFLIGSGAGAVGLAAWSVIYGMSMQLAGALAAGTATALGTAWAAWNRGCFGK